MNMEDAKKRDAIIQNGGGSAFPYCDVAYKALGGDWRTESVPGLTPREYACIHLRVPESGKDWLDEIIRKSQANELVGQALNGLCGCIQRHQLWEHDWEAEHIVNAANELANAMEARGK